MAVKTDGEAIVQLQTEMTQTRGDISNLRGDIATVKSDTSRILEQILTLPQHYVTRQEFEVVVRQLQKRGWVQNTLSAAMGAIFVAVVGAMAYALFVGRSH